jgi:two-component system, OmpR family, response regulator
MVQWLTLSLPRILVVDDNPELLTLLSSSFEEAGYSVLTASRGRSALDLARKEKPSLAIVDVLLPDLMGFDVAEMLKRLKIPFIFISGVHKGGVTAKGAGAKYGAIGYFEKPFDRKALLDAVRRVVPVAMAPQREIELDLEGAPPVAEEAEAMELTSRIDLTAEGSHVGLRGGGKLALKPMGPEQQARLSGAASPATRRISVSVPTEPPPPGRQDEPEELPADALQPIASKDSVRRGELKDNLPNLFAAFYQARETGELGLQKGQVKKVVYFESGMPVFALSNLVADRLGQFLVRAGKIDEATLESAADEASRSKQRTGDVLISMGVLTEEERLYYIAQQIKSILYSLFAWETGSFALSFQARARREMVKLDIHPANLIVRGVKKLYKPERLRRLLGAEERLIPSPDPAFNLSDVELQAWEAHLLPRCDGTRTVADLVKLSGRPENEAWATLVALRALRVLDVR